MLLRKSSNKGFTLIELVVVIVILGILAAFAIPRFISIESEARAAAIDGLSGSLRSAAALAHSVSLAKGYSASTSISMDGLTVTMALHYPTGNAAGIGTAISDLTGFTADYATTAGTATYTSTNAATGASCKVDYVQPTVSGFAPTVTATTTDCS